MRAARVRANIDYPYLSNALMSVKIKETESIPTAGMSETGILYYNPKYFKGLSIEQASAVLVHEVWHLLRLHSERARSYGVPDDEAIRWNLGADSEINDSLKGLPDEAVLPSRFGFRDGLTAEEYYDLLEDKVQKISVGVTCGDCGSAADGKGRSHEEGEAEEGMSEMEKKLIASQTAKEIQNQAKSRGDIPNKVARWADAVLDPQVDWRRELRNLVKYYIYSCSGRTDFSFRKPSRRARCTKAILPNMVGYKSTVAVIIDTSGSMDDRSLQEALSELSGILRSDTQKVYFIAADAEVHVKRTIRSIHQAELVGGGGTDMALAIREADKLKTDIIVCITDCYTPWPKEKPKSNVIICATRNHADNIPEWAKKVSMEE